VVDLLIFFVADKT